MIMVSSDGIPVPYSVDAYGYMESFYRMKNVWWNVAGVSNCRNENEENFILDLAEKYPNLTGAFADELLSSGRTPNEVKETLEKVRKTLDKSNRHLELWSANYIDDKKIYSNPEIYEHLDGITIWNIHTDEALYMEEQFEMYEKLLPTKKKMD